MFLSVLLAKYTCISNQIDNATLMTLYSRAANERASRQTASPIRGQRMGSKDMIMDTLYANTRARPHISDTGHL